MSYIFVQSSTLKAHGSKLKMLFRKLSIVTIVIVYLLILAGGIVRSTGSGMGCPDWPKCFGSWVPPTEESQLPFNYKAIYAKQLHGEVIFNPLKTWIEYLNRLLGALTGIVVFAAFIASIISFWKKDRRIVYLAGLSVILVGINGGLGKLVVDNNLKPVVVTAHMLLAILVVFVLLYTIARSYSSVIETEKINNARSLNRILVITLGLSLLQIVLGTQVREAIDEVAKIYGDNRYVWIEQMGLPFIIHRSFSWIVLIAHIFLIRSLWKNIAEKGILNRFVKIFSNKC